MADDGNSSDAAPAARLVIAIPPPPGASVAENQDQTSPPRPSLTLTVATPTPASEHSVDVFHDALDSLSATASATSAPTARRVQFPGPRGAARSPPHRRSDGAHHHAHAHAHRHAHGVAAGTAPPRHPPRSLADLDAVLSDEELLLDDDDDDDDDDELDDDELAALDELGEPYAVRRDVIDELSSSSDDDSSSSDDSSDPSEASDASDEEEEEEEEDVSDASDATDLDALHRVELLVDGEATPTAVDVDAPPVGDNDVLDSAAATPVPTTPPADTDDTAREVPSPATTSTAPAIPAHLAGRTLPDRWAEIVGHQVHDDKVKKYMAYRVWVTAQTSSSSDDATPTSHPGSSGNATPSSLRSTIN
ncbi:hypothetical protein AMAG_16830 [Allomyces macrogynus ATCC 38327]|uniref:Uncharacterized protein n=1 Tax=Allomyces macrogynus (strain ATCC 38327) TaxID=578462 RepID=A0A0L0TCA7_ALLM3|nr:hypothetical protein AMAG_16830 [Allomyces macrogynus ATCC 38327]|eukprot:KNE72346.1 hypothetical protein AMAG_16830 [Allomyces macrogynus ATCC 38327]